jgi:hypothetical protein
VIRWEPEAVPLIEFSLAGAAARLLSAGGRFSERVHLIEVEVTEQGRDYSALWNAFLTRSFQHDLQKVHDVRVINPLGHFFQQPVVPDIVKVGE